MMVLVGIKELAADDKKQEDKEKTVLNLLTYVNNLHCCWITDVY